MDVDVETADWPTPFLRIKIRVEVSRGFYLANWILDNFPRRGKKSMGNRATTTEKKKKKWKKKMAISPSRNQRHSKHRFY